MYTQKESCVGAPFLAKRCLPWNLPRYGALDNNEHAEFVKKHGVLPSNLVLTEFYTFMPAIYHAGYLGRIPDRGECEFPDIVNLLVQSDRTINGSRLDGLRMEWAILKTVIASRSSSPKQLLIKLNHKTSRQM